jgi:hypothetical protein
VNWLSALLRAEMEKGQQRLLALVGYVALTALL